MVPQARAIRARNVLSIQDFGFTPPSYTALAWITTAQSTATVTLIHLRDVYLVSRYAPTYYHTTGAESRLCVPWTVIAFRTRKPPYRLPAVRGCFLLEQRRWRSACF